MGESYSTDDGYAPPEDELLGELEVFQTPSFPVLSVQVDFNDLLQDHDEEKTWELLGKLKDLLS